MNENLFEEYCLADPVFFETQKRWGHSRSAFPQVGADLPEGWRRRERDVWVLLHPAGHRLPRQGWKVHVSACLDNADRVLDVTYRYCLSQRVPFKFLASRNVLRAQNLKYASRSASGKLIAIYPDSEEQLHTVLTELGELLAGEPGPYILTDLRWGDGPLYVRYGAFLELFCPDENGALVPAIAKPDGTLVPDRRAPTFQVPDWVTLPDFLAPHLAARQDTAAIEFPYRVDRAMHFSNGGGVYLAYRESDGRKVVLKEARPFAGLDRNDRDAVARLRVERDALRRLAGIPGIPELYEYRTAWEHEFLVQEYLPGDSLFSWMADNYPLAKADPTDAEIADYTARALKISDQVDQLVAAIHDRGMYMGDLHPTNLIINADEEVQLTDFELARDVSEPLPSSLGYPGFENGELSGQDADRYAAVALKLWFFLPLVELTSLAPGKTAEYLDAIDERFALPPGYVEQIRATLVPAAGPARLGPLTGTPDVDLTQPEPDWPATLKSLSEAILLSATPQREDRLFPGDPQQFIFGGHGFASGAAGVLWALQRTGIGRFPQFEEWLCRAAARAPRDDPGFYGGLSGLAHVLAGFGHTDTAAPLLDQSLELAETARDVSLHNGLAGVALAALAHADMTGQVSYATAASDIAVRLIDAVDSPEPHGIDVVVSPNGTPDKRLGARAGLMRGWSGPALLLLRCFERFGDTTYLDAAVRAIHRDLDLCLWTPDDSLQVDGGFRVLGYLEVGSAGIALASAELLRHRPDDRISESLPALARACMPEFVIDAQLMNGRAGMLATLARLAEQRPELDLRPVVDRHLCRLAWHAVPYRGHLAFPGRRSRRLSMDLATGNAGAMLAIAAATGGQTDFLPFLAGAPVDTGVGPAPLTSVGGR